MQRHTMQPNWALMYLSHAYLMYSQSKSKMTLLYTPMRVLSDLNSWNTDTASTIKRVV